jgi:hypothetical protein
VSRKIMPNLRILGNRGKKRSLTSRLLKKSYFAGCSKMSGCKAPEILRSEAYLDVRRNDEG